MIGSARSGTTWLGDLLAAALRARVVFEPFHPVHVAGMAPFGLMPYRSPEDQDPAFLEFCRSVFSGALRGPWVDREANRILPSGRVVKCVRANLFTGWLGTWLPEVPVVVLVRHPASVVRSRMEAGWDASTDVDALLGNERLVRDHLADHVEWARSLSTEEERNALIWAIHHRVTFRQRDPGNGAEVAFYEDVVADPAAVLAGVLDRLGRRAPPLPERRLRRPSSTARRGRATGTSAAAPGPRGLGEAALGRVLSVVERLDLDWVYGSGARPTPAARERLGHARS